MNFLSSYFRYLSKEIIPKVLGFDFKRDFQSNFKTKLKENNLNTQWKWWTVCMPRLKRQIVPHSVKVKICIKYRKHWKAMWLFICLGRLGWFGWYWNCRAKVQKCNILSKGKFFISIFSNIPKLEKVKVTPY